MAAVDLIVRVAKRSGDADDLEYRVRRSRSQAGEVTEWITTGVYPGGVAISDETYRVIRIDDADMTTDFADMLVAEDVLDEGDVGFDFPPRYRAYRLALRDLATDKLAALTTRQPVEDRIDYADLLLTYSELEAITVQKGPEGRGDDGLPIDDGETLGGDL